MPTLTIDDRELTVEAGTSILEAAKKVGIEIPHYCYHPGLPVVGQCRMCQVEVEKAPKLAIGCATPVAEGMVVRTASPPVEKARKSVLEFYLLNHPLDCPICDKGGECPLQEYTLRYGPGESRYEERKIQRIKKTPIGPHVIFDAERCILCTRCVRFVQNVVGSGELGVFDRGDRATIGLFPGKSLDNNYSGNVIDLCPVGALTSRDFRFMSRPWNLEKRVESVCASCSFGCNIVLDVRHVERRGERILRIRPRENREVNGYWMCDVGRFGFHYIHDEARLTAPHASSAPGRSPHAPIPWDAVTCALGERLRQIVETAGPQAVGVIASSRLTNEDLFLVKKFFGTLIGTPHRDHRVRAVQEPGQDRQEEMLYRADKTPNTAGARAVGLLPGPGGLSAREMVRAASSGALKALFIFQEDLVEEWRDIPVAAALSSVSLLVVSSLTLTATARRAHYVLPAVTFAEQDGTFTNFQGRIQRIRQALPLPGEIRPLPDVLDGIATVLGKPLGPVTPEKVWEEMGFERIGPLGLLPGSAG